MKRVIIVVSLFVAGIFNSHAQDACDSVKLKTIKTEYVEITGYDLDIKGELDGAVINIDTLPVLHPTLTIVNISNDTFFSAEQYEIGLQMFFFVYNNTNSILFSNRTILDPQPMPFDWYPNDIKNILCFKYTFSEIIDAIESTGVNFDQISYWVTAYGVSYTSKDGTLSDSLFYVGADISTFRVVRSGVGIAGRPQESPLQVYPNPAKNQLIIECKDGACPVPTEEYVIYSVVGQVVMRGTLPCRDAACHVLTTINVESLASGMYFLEIGNKTVKFVKE